MDEASKFTHLPTHPIEWEGDEPVCPCTQTLRKVLFGPALALGAAAIMIATSPLQSAAVSGVILVLLLPIAPLVVVFSAVYTITHAKDVADLYPGGEDANPMALAAITLLCQIVVIGLGLAMALRVAPMPGF
ncbi:MAG: hypothetical protein KDA32_08355 [Phycisphaerales bacterium]|nr:hypothetical protein [Phycisphaerales bacterium]